jgi:hypothetical protein
MRKLILILFVFCTLALPATPSRATTVVLAGSVASAKYIRTELYFGMSRKGSTDISEVEFQRFIDEFVTPRFPEGLTILDASGQWREGNSTVTKERSKVMILVYLRNERRDAGRKIEEIRAEYKRKFSQQSVLRVDQTDNISVKF